MTMVDSNAVDLVSGAGGVDESAANRLRTEFLGLRLSFSWFGTRKSLSNEQKARAAESFGAEGDYLSAGKKLLNTKAPEYKAVSQVKSAATAYWRSVSLPYPESGIRLIRAAELDDVVNKLTDFQQDLSWAVECLNDVYGALVESARERLGDLFCSADYPDSLIGLFSLAWDFPSLEPPSYLRQLSPRYYREECARVQARFAEAVALAESAFTEELAKLVEHLGERLQPGADGKKKTFRDTAINNLQEFFERFQNLSIGSNDELESLVERARAVVSGVDPGSLRDSADLRARVAAGLAGVQSSLDGLLVDRPRRNIDRGPIADSTPGEGGEE